MFQNFYPNQQSNINELQNIRDRIDLQLRQAQQFPPQINQTFQLTPNQNLNDLDGKIVNNVDEVKNTFTLKKTLFLDKDTTNLWIKDTSGNIKTYTLTEVIELDEKDKKILSLQKQIEELKGVVENAKSDYRNVNEPIENAKPSNISTSVTNEE